MWERCWSLARIHLRLSDEAFFGLTPRQFHVLLDQQQRQVEHEELLAGIIASTVANWSMGAPKKAMKPSDFMPSRMNQRAQRINRKEVAENVRAFFDRYKKATGQNG